MAGPGLLEPGAEPPMTRGAARGRKMLVQEFAVEIMPEQIQLPRRTIRPTRRAGLSKESAFPGQSGAADFDLLNLDVQYGGDRWTCKLAADDARGTKKLAVDFVEIADLPLDEAAYIPGNGIDRDERLIRRRPFEKFTDDAR